MRLEPFARTRLFVDMSEDVDDKGDIGGNSAMSAMGDIQGVSQCVVNGGVWGGVINGEGVVSGLCDLVQGTWA